MAVLKDLIVHGSSRFLNTSYFNQLKTDKIGAEEGIFNKIVATTGDIGSLTVDDLTAGKATVLSLLDVRGELHTNQWTNSNIATIDGSFYITPTIGVPSGTMTTTANSVVINGSNFPISSLYVNGVNSDNTATTVAWTSDSKVLVTGEILVNGVYMPLGTLIGTLSADATASQIQVGSITDNRYQTAESLAEIGTQSTALPCRNVKVSLYQTSRSSTLYPLGIFMTALGENGKTFLDIYGGGYATSTATAGGFAKPVLRIGNLAGLPAVGGSTPTGYGIYTSNGYFSGAIVAKQGKIGDGTAAWTIGNDSNNRAYIYSGITNITTSGSTTGTYVGTNGISNYSSTTQYVNLTGGKITAQGADIAGKITASSGSIGGWNIGTDTNKSLYYGNQTPGATTTNLVLSPTSATNSNAIGGSGTGLTWFISAGKVFGVTTAGALYSTSGKIGGFDIGATYLRNGNIASATNTSVAGVYLGTDGLNISNGTAATTSYITKTAVNIGNKLTWNGTTLTIDGSASIGGTTASTVVSNAADGAAAKTGLDNLEIGGKNFIPLSSNLKSFIIENASCATATWTDSNVTILNINTTSSTYGIYYQWIPVEPNTTYTLSFTCSSIVGTARSSGGFRKSDNTTIGNSLWNHTVLNYAQVSNGRNVRTFTTPDESATMRIYLSTTNKDSQMIVSNIKLEKGNKATDWTPAPEDLDVHKYVTDIDTNNGITIKAINGTADTNTTTGNYIKLNASGLDIYNAGASVAFYGATARVGKSSTARVEIDSSPYVNLYNNSNKLALSVQGSGLFVYDQNSYKRAGVTSDGFILYDGASSSTTTQLGSFTASSGNATIKLGQEAANKFNILITDTAVSSKGPGILLRQGTDVLNEITADGMNIYLASDTTNSIAEFGDNIRIGATSTGHAVLDDDGMDVYIGDTSVAHYGDYARIGKEGEANTKISTSEVSISAGDNINALRITPDGNTQIINKEIDIAKTIKPDASYSYTHPSEASTGEIIKYRVVSIYTGTTRVFTVTKGTSVSNTTITDSTAFKFRYSATTTAITVKNLGSQNIRLEYASFKIETTSPLTEVGGVLTVGQYPNVGSNTVFAVGNGTEGALSNACVVRSNGSVDINGSSGIVTINGKQVWPSKPIVSLHFTLTPSSYASGSKLQNLPVSLPSGYQLLCPNMVGSYVSGNATCIVTDNTIHASGTALSIDYYLYNPNNATNLIIHGNVLCERIQ